MNYLRLSWCILLTIMTISTSFSQEVVGEMTETPSKKDTTIFTAVEQQAEFKGGQAALMKFLCNNLRYPEDAQQNGISGRVIVKFVVEKDGTITNPQIAKGADTNLDKEALRVVKAMPKWIPAIINGVPVRSYYYLPLNFSLQQ